MIFISAGHYPAAKGAGFNGVYEHDVAKQWCLTLASVFSQLARSVSIVPTGTIIEKVQWINKRVRDKTAIAIEIHFNSDTSKTQKGSETLYCPGSVRGKRVAEAMQTGLSVICPPSRGVKEGWYRMDRPGVKDFAGDVDGDEVIDYFLRATDCTAIIVEPEFIYNYNVIVKTEYQACEVIANAIVHELDREEDV